MKKHRKFPVLANLPSEVKAEIFEVDPGESASEVEKSEVKDR